MFNQQFYFQTIRKYVALFGTLFNEISITRINPTSGRTEAFIKVPVTYAPKEKMLTRFVQDPNIDRPSATVTMPFISFEMTSINYDPTRKLNTINQVIVEDPDNPNKLKYQYNPVPYNFGFRLYVYVKNAEDGTKIVEQILPYFTPDFTATVNLIPEMNINMDIPVIMSGISQEDRYEGDFRERQVLIWTLDFVLKGYIYGPVKKGAIIKFANTVIYTPQQNVTEAPGQASFAQYTIVTPGLTANGQPTTSSNNSISPLQIEVTDNFGYVVETTYGL